MIGGKGEAAGTVRDETDLIEQVGGSDFVAASTCCLMSLERWIQYLMKLQTLTG